MSLAKRTPKPQVGLRIARLVRESRYRRAVNARLWFFIAIGLGLAGTLATASCGPTCPGNNPNCGLPNSATAGAAGAAGATSTASCDQLTQLRSCMSAFCATADLSNPFCKCYKNGFDLSTASCSCVAFDAQKFCTDQAESGVSYDCSSATGAVGTACVGVN